MSLPLIGEISRKWVCLSNGKDFVSVEKVFTLGGSSYLYAGPSMPGLGLPGPAWNEVTTYLTTAPLKGFQ